MSVTQLELKNHFLELGKKGALYVWGANGQIITKELMDKLYGTFKSSKYNRSYYNSKLNVGKGKPGADCSGAFYPVSGYDTTAAGYYNKCKQKGKIDTISKDQVCMVFKKNSSGNINHVGLYTGDGYVSEMASSDWNYRRKKLAGNGWDLWGIPDFVSDSGTVEKSIATSGKEYTKVVGVIDTVAEVQSWLNDRFHAGLIVDNCYGPKTKKALIKALQTTMNYSYGAGLNVDGVFGPKTKAACRVLKRGSKSELVKVLQAMLICKGYYSAYLDGEYGAKTEAAVYAYQKKKAIAQDKKVGPETFQALCK